MIRFRKGTNRSPEAYVLRVGEATFYISYETVVAAAGVLDGQYVTKRLHNRWGPTTGKHMNEMGVRGYPEVEDDKFSEFVDDLIINAVRSKITDNFKENSHG